MTWDEIQKWVNSAATQGNPVAQKFVRLNFFDNSITLRLSDPYEHLNEDEADEDQNDEDADNTQKNKKKAKKQQPKAKKKEMEVDLDLGLTADQNARQHFTERKAAAVKQQKTLQSSAVALKNAQKQAQNKVKQVRSRIYDRIYPSCLGPH
jgi:predicted ribosome quality control (RQC) complex YloA/Tae2 family protein